MSDQEIIELFKDVNESGIVLALHKEHIEAAIKALEQTSDKNCSQCRDRGACAIFDNFNIDYCSDWRK